MGLKHADFLTESFQMKIRGNDSMNKNYLGALLSLMGFVTILAAIVYFLTIFFGRKDINILKNDQITNQVSMDITKVPMMIRVSLSGGKIIENDESVYQILYQKKYTEPGSSSQIQHNLDVERCDIDKHFGEYRYLFQNMTDLTSFFCPVYHNNVKDGLFGVYGDTDPFSYYHFKVRGCRNDTSGGKCSEKSYVDKTLGKCYLDYRVLDFQIDHNNVDHPVAPFVRGERGVLSNTVSKRIWKLFKNTHYESDTGFVFEELKKYDTYQFFSNAADMDLRDIEGDSDPGTFLKVTMSLTIEKVSYKRVYMKAQTFLAQIGGLVKGIWLIAVILNMFFSTKINYIEIIDQAVEKKLFNNHNLSNHNLNTNQASDLASLSGINKSIVPLFTEVEMNDKKNTLNNNNKISGNEALSLNNNNLVNVNNNLSSKNDINVVGNENNRFASKFGNENNINPIHMPKSNNNSNNKTFSTTSILCPQEILCNKKEKTSIKNLMNTIDKKASIISIISKSNELDSLKMFMFNSDQRIVFDYLFSSESSVSNNDEAVYNNSYLNLSAVIHKSVIDKKLIEAVKTRRFG